jgi:hypothetical protein
MKKFRKFLGLSFLAIIFIWDGIFTFTYRTTLLFASQKMKLLTAFLTASRTLSYAPTEGKRFSRRFQPSAVAESLVSEP